MRTTLWIDDDVLMAVEKYAARQRRPVGAVLSELARKALIGEARGTPAMERHGFRTLPPRGPLVSNALIDRLRDGEPD